MKKHRQQPHRGGFTLIELIIVLFILIMVMGVAVVAYQGQRDVANRRAALAYVKMLATQINNFDGIVGRPPTTAEGLGALVTQPPEVQEGRWGGPYLESYAVSIDPWGNEYQYVCPGRDGRRFDVWSFGPNMMDEGGEGDDIGHWMSP